MDRTEQITELTKSLAKFHALVGKIKKDAKNPFFKSNYASLSHILEEVAQPMQDSGLVISQFPDDSSLVTMLIHADTGQYISSSYIMPVSKQNDPQALGSAISYARRYAITSILSLNIDDDDAEAATKPTRNQQAEDTRPWLNKGAQLNEAMDYLRKGGKIETIEKKYRINKEIRASLQTVIDGLS